MAAVLQIKHSQHTARVPVTVFELAGELDAGTYEQFQQEAQQAIDAGARYVVLDFNGLRYISSAGLRALYVIAKMLSSKSGTAGVSDTSTGLFKSPFLKLLNPTGSVRTALEVMGFNMSMEIHGDLQAALESF